MFKLGAGLGFACLYLFEFRADWWHDPSQIEWIGVAAGCFTALIYLAIILTYETSTRVDEAPQPEPMEAPRPIEPAIVAASAQAVPKPKPQPRRRPRRPGPAVMAQRAAFAAQGQKMLARRAAQQQPIKWRL